jgi:hypothetical protein
MVCTVNVTVTGSSGLSSHAQRRIQEADSALIQQFPKATGRPLYTDLRKLLGLTVFLRFLHKVSSGFLKPLNMGTSWPSENLLCCTCSFTTILRKYYVFPEQ